MLEFIQIKSGLFILYTLCAGAKNDLPKVFLRAQFAGPLIASPSPLCRRVRFVMAFERALGKNGGFADVFCLTELS